MIKTKTICTKTRIVGVVLLVFSFVVAIFKYQINRAVLKSQAPLELQVSPVTETTVNGIPLIIHQLYSHDSFPLDWYRAQRSWESQSVRNIQHRQYNEFLYKFWTDDLIDRFVRQQYPWFYSTFRRYSSPISKTDAARYLVLYHYGGTYSDLDIECVNESIRVILSRLQNRGVGLMKTDPFGVTNDLIIASKGHPFLKHVISGLIPAQMNYGLPYLTVMASAGSMYLTEKYGVYENKKDIMIFSKEIYVGKYFKHYKGGSWHSWDGRIIWFLYNKINSLFSNDGKKSLAAFK